VEYDDRKLKLEQEEIKEEEKACDESAETEKKEEPDSFGRRFMIILKNIEDSNLEDD